MDIKEHIPMKQKSPNPIAQYLSKKDKPYIILAIILGCANHFLYDFSGGAALVALFCPVNESVWEHLKLIFFPLLAVSLLEYLRFQAEPARFFYNRFLSTLYAMFSTVTLFYTYTGIIGKDFFIIDILIFVFSILLAFSAYNYRCKSRRDTAAPGSGFVFAMWAVIALLFFIFTCFPPDLPLFYPDFG